MTELPTTGAEGQIIDIALYEGGKAKIEGVADPIKLSSNENPFGTPEAARENCDAILKFYGEAETGHAAQSVAQYIADKLK